jgi:hypothetical protein
VFVRCRKCRGGAPEGVRVSLDARRIRKDAEVGQTASPGVPLPFSSFLFSLVIAGLDRAIHTAKRLKQNPRWPALLDVGMDRRIMGERKRRRSLNGYVRR